MGRTAGSCRVTTALAVVLLFTGIAGCAQKGPLLLDGIAYRAPEDARPAVLRTTVAVVPFQDQRGAAVAVVGKRTIRDYVENDLVVQGSAADLVAAALRDALRSRGVIVADRTGGAPDADLVISGEIRTLWVDVLSQTLNVQTKAAVQLRAVVAEGPDRKVFRTITLNSSLAREDVAFSFDMVRDALSEALTGAINQLLADEEFKKRIR
jgi:predicted small lipoprotein YifL